MSLRHTPSARCRVMSRQATEAVFDQTEPSSRVGRHVDRCLSCQADVAQARSVSRALRSLRGEIEAAPEALVMGVMADLDLRVVGQRPMRSKRMMPAFAAAAATAAVVVLMARWRIDRAA